MGHRLLCSLRWFTKSTVIAAKIGSGLNDENSRLLVTPNSTCLLRHKVTGFLAIGSMKIDAGHWESLKLNVTSQYVQHTQPPPK